MLSVTVLLSANDSEKLSDDTKVSVRFVTDVVSDIDFAKERLVDTVGESELESVGVIDAERLGREESVGETVLDRERVSDFAFRRWIVAVSEKELDIIWVNSTVVDSELVTDKVLDVSSERDDVRVTSEERESDVVSDCEGVSDRDRLSL